MSIKTATQHIHTQLTRDQLMHKALERKEGVLATNKAFSATTGKRTGRSPRDKFLVEDEKTKKDGRLGNN